jgi:hypothetical protein
VRTFSDRAIAALVKWECWEPNYSSKTAVPLKKSTFETPLPKSISSEYVRASLPLVWLSCLYRCILCYSTSHTSASAVAFRPHWTLKFLMHSMECWTRSPPLKVETSTHRCCTGKHSVTTKCLLVWYSFTAFSW